jgi:acid phosphatase
VLVAVLAAAAMLAQAAPTASAARVPRLRHVWVFVLENHSYDQVIGSREAPFLNRVARRHGQATHFYAVTHPSLPNYLAMISGSTHGCTSDGCNGPYPGLTLAGQLARHGMRWRGYFEGLPRAGYIGGDVSSYTQHHDPFVYFQSVINPLRQRRNVVPFSKFPGSLRRPPAFSYIVPNDAHNMHTGSIREADNWLRYWVPRVIATRAFRHRGVVIITWDEADKGDHSGCCLRGIDGGHQPLIVIAHRGRLHARIRHTRSAYSLLRTIESGFRFQPLGRAARVRPLAGFW